MDGSKIVYLVVERDVVVATDLAEAILMSDPAAEVHLALGVAEAEALLDVLPPVGAAVVNASIAELRKTAFAARVERGGGRVVVLSGTETEDDKARSGWRFVRRPFSTDVVLAALTEAGRPACSAGVA